MKEYICICFYQRNIFLKQYNIHVTFKNERAFKETYRQILRMKGCATEKQFLDVLSQVQNEVQERQQYHQLFQERYNFLQQNYTRLHPDIWNLKISHLDLNFMKIVDVAKQKSLDKLLQSIGNNNGLITEAEVFRFPVFTPEFCKKLIEEAANIDQTPGPRTQPNTMNTMGVSFDEAGLSNTTISSLLRNYVMPISAVLFRHWGGDAIDSFKSFLVKYEQSADVDLAVHFDNSEVTINISLDEEYEGGNLRFGGICGQDDDEDFSTVIKQKMGHGILHCGRQFHSATPITSGQRHNLVIWMRCSAIRNKVCPMCDEKPSLMEVPAGGEGFILPDDYNSRCCCS